MLCLLYLLTAPVPFLLYSHGVNISRANTDLTHKKTLVSGLGNSTACDYLFVDGVGFFADSKNKYIGMFKLDGSTMGKTPTRVVSNIGHVEGLAVNWVNRTLTWSDVTSKRIYTSKIDGTGQKTLVTTGIVNPRALALQPFTG